MTNDPIPYDWSRLDASIAKASAKIVELAALAKAATAKTRERVSTSDALLRTAAQTESLRKKAAESCRKEETSLRKQCRERRLSTTWTVLCICGCAIVLAMLLMARLARRIAVWLVRKALGLARWTLRLIAATIIWTIAKAQDGSRRACLAADRAARAAGRFWRKIGNRAAAIAAAIAAACFPTRGSGKPH